jgi:hypothetical protein
MDNQDTSQQQYNTRIKQKQEKQNQEQNELRPGAMHGLTSVMEPVVKSSLLNLMNDLWLARISSLSNEVGLYVVLLEVLLFMPNSLIRHSK